MSRTAIIASTAALLLIGGANLYLFGQQTPKPATPPKPERADKVLEGELIDMHCYISGESHGEKHAACGQKCAASGIPAGLLTEVDGKPVALTLMTNPKPLAEYMSKTVRVSGKASHSAMAMEPEKIEVKEGNNWKAIKLEDAMHK